MEIHLILTSPQRMTGEGNRVDHQIVGFPRDGKQVFVRLFDVRKKNGPHNVLAAGSQGMEPKPLALNFGAIDFRCRDCDRVPALAQTQTYRDERMNISE